MSNQAKTIALIIIALASQYAPGVMDRVIENRQAGRTFYHLPASLPRVAGYIAVADCSRIGQIMWLMPIGGQRLESFLITDCARPDGADGTLEWMKRYNIFCEVDFQTAERWDTVGKMIKITQMEKPRIEK